MEIRLEKDFGESVQRLLKQHLTSMHEQSPPESVHALDLSKLAADNISFYCAWDESNLMGCGALMAIDSNHGEIKSMRTADSYLRQGVAARLLARIIKDAKERRYEKLSLETGSMETFEPARQLYRQFGFVACGPFNGYEEDPNSCYMSLNVQKKL